LRTRTIHAVAATFAFVLCAAATPASAKKAAETPPPGVQLNCPAGTSLQKITGGGWACKSNNPVQTIPNAPNCKAPYTAKWVKANGKMAWRCLVP